jgi:ATP-dependent helicase/nuclease subunit A
MKKPLFLQERTGLSAAEAGTSMHFVMQHLDLKQDDIENQIQVMVGKDLLTEQQAAGIDPEKIRSFIVSRLGRRMLASAKIHREVPFNLEIPCSEVYPELDECDLETILLQGVIDCYFEEPDGLVIIDYKTDYVPDDGMEMIKNRYRIQIGYYAKALAILTGRKVKETYIYLFSNGEVVKYE